MTTRTGKPITTIATALLFCSTLPNVCSAGEYYKWVDDKGVTHFSERPTQTEGVEKIKTSVRQPTAEEKAKIEEKAEIEEKAKTEEIAAATAVAQSEHTEQDQIRCTDSQERLKSLASGSRIRMDDGKGGFYYLDQQQVTQEVQKTRQAIEESCKK